MDYSRGQKFDRVGRYERCSKDGRSFVLTVRIGPNMIVRPHVRKWDSRITRGVRLRVSGTVRFVQWERGQRLIVLGLDERVRWV